MSRICAGYVKSRIGLEDSDDVAQNVRVMVYGGDTLNRAGKVGD